MKNQWGLFKRKRKKGVVWYYWYYDDKGIRQHQSTGKSVKWRAEEYVKEKFAQTSTNPNIILNEFATDFFDYETSRWIKRLPIGRDIVSKEFSRALDRAEIKTDGRNLRTHSLRHTIIGKWGL